MVLWVNRTTNKVNGELEIRLETNFWSFVSLIGLNYKIAAVQKLRNAEEKPTLKLPKELNLSIDE